MNKSNKKLLPAVATAVVVLLVMCGIGSAGYITITKDTASSDPAVYKVGDTITYNMTVMIPTISTSEPPDDYWFKVTVTDTYPNGNVEVLETDLELFYNGTRSKKYVRTYVVAEPDINTSWVLSGHWVVNYIEAHGIDNIQGAPGTGSVDGSTDCPSKIARDPTANFTFDAGDCDLTVQFTPTANDPDGTIAKYEWDFENDGTTDETTTSDSSFPYTFPASGDYDVNLTVTDNDGLTDWIVKPVHITAPPTVDQMTVSPTSVTVPPGGWVTVTGTVSDPDGDDLTYKWTIVNATGTHVITGGPIVGPPYSTISTTCFVDKVPTTVTLEVKDPVNCVASAQVPLGRPPQYVPLLTLPGLLALIGMMCIVGAGRIITRGRRS